MEQVSFRIESGLKASAGVVFASYGLSPTQAVRLFFKQVSETGALPFLTFENLCPATAAEAVKIARLASEVKAGKRKVKTYTSAAAALSDTLAKD